MKRCNWATTELLRDYHDKEWGRPEREDKKLFELLILETMQAGLSWETVLKKRENYREALDNFEVEIIKEYSDEKMNELLNNPGIIRNKLKIQSIKKNASAFVAVREEWSSFAQYLWSFVGNEPINNAVQDKSEVPAQNELSQQMSKDMKRRGFSFVGPTVCYAYMQAAGLINDHLVDCAFK